MRRRRDVERRILAEDSLFQLAHPSARLEPELAERPMRVVIGPERLRLAATAVERHHQLLTETLPVRVRVDQRLQRAHHVRMPARRQLHLDDVLDAGQPQLLESHDLASRLTRIAQLLQRLSTELRKRLSKRQHGLSGLLRAGASACRLNLPCVETLLAYDELIASPGREDPLSSERLSQRAHVALHDLRCRWRRMLGPERVGDAVGRERLVRVQEQQREERTRATWRKLQPAGLPPNLQRPEDAELHQLSVTLTPSTSGVSFPTVVRAFPGVPDPGCTGGCAQQQPRAKERI